MFSLISFYKISFALSIGDGKSYRYQ